MTRLDLGASLVRDPVGLSIGSLYECAQIAQVGYDTSWTAAQGDLAVIDSNWQLVQANWFDVAATSTSGFVAKWTGTQPPPIADVLVVFAGTSDWWDCWTDAQQWGYELDPVDFPCTEGPAGMVTAWQSASDVVLATVASLLGTFTATPTVAAVGHSLGGALAEYAAATIAKRQGSSNMPACDVLLATFGQPPCADNCLALLWGDLAADMTYLRVINPGDPIPSLSAPLGWEHVGGPPVVIPNTSVSWNPKTNHQLNAYTSVLHSLVEPNQGHFPWGSGGNTAFTDAPWVQDPTRYLTQIDVWWGNVVDAMQFTYNVPCALPVSNGGSASAGRRGGSGGSSHATIELQGFDYITKVNADVVSYKGQSCIGRLTFTCSISGTHGPYGSTTGTPQVYVADAPAAIAAIQGTSNGNTSGSYLNQLTFLELQFPDYTYGQPTTGPGGDAWDDCYLVTLSNRIEAFAVQAGSRLGSIQAHYADTISGFRTDGVMHGTSAAVPTPLDYDEYLVGLQAWTQSTSASPCVQAIEITTNKSSYRFGTIPDQPAGLVVSCATDAEIVGFWGRAGDALDAIGCIIRPLSMRQQAQRENAWRYCNRCGGLSYAGWGASGICPAPPAGGGHNQAPPTTYDYVLELTGVAIPANIPHEDGWKWCNRCDQLWWATSGGGICPAGGPHDPGDPAAYTLTLASPLVGGQPGWAKCSQCAAVFFTGRSSVCPYNGGNHQATPSLTYAVWYSIYSPYNAAPNQSRARSTSMHG